MSPWGVVTVVSVALVSVVYAVILDGLDRAGYWQGPPFTIITVVIGFGITVGIPTLAIALGVATTAMDAVRLIWASIFAGGAAIGIWYGIGYQRTLCQLGKQ